MNLTKWRDRGISSQVIEYLKRNPDKIYFPDQDALNAVLHDKWLRLDPKWNCPALLYNSTMFPAIIHYTTPDKPWNGNPQGKNRYMEYFYKTLW